MRRKLFTEQISSTIQIKCDSNKIKKALILKDKVTNPLKYNYLANAKGLSDEVIFDQYKDFQLVNKDNQKNLGDKYLKDSKISHLEKHQDVI